MFRPGPKGAPASTWVDNPTTTAEEELRNCKIPSSVGVAKGPDCKSLMENQDEVWAKTGVVDNVGIGLKSMDSDLDSEGSGSVRVEFCQVEYDTDDADATVPYVDDGDDEDIHNISAEPCE